MSAPAPIDPDFVLRGKDEAVHSLAASPFNSNVLFAGTQTGQILSWNLETRRVAHRISAHSGHCVLWLLVKDEDHLLSVGRDGQLCQFTCNGPTWACEGKYVYSKVKYTAR